MDSNKDYLDPTVEDDLDEQNNNNDVTNIKWAVVNGNFEPKMKLSPKEGGTLLCELDRSASPLDALLCLFPKSLFIYIAQNTNRRIEKENESSKNKHTLTDAGEIMIVIGCTLVMGYNKLPSLHYYWSSKQSMKNDCIADAISRDRFCFLLSKLYFADPQKPTDAGKTYYIDDVVNCFKKNFMKCYSDSTRQSIDESMTKFKGRSSLKQYQPMKPIKRGIKCWQRCDALTGYTYDFDIYAGKDVDANSSLGLGEKVVTKLCSSIKKDGVAMCFDRFFSSVKLFTKLDICAVGTYMATRKHTPTLDGKLSRGETQFMQSNMGVIAMKWCDTKNVHVMSNCHKPEIGTAVRTSKNGDKLEVACPQAIIFYNEFMMGVDRSDQSVASHSFERKSNKWWKKVFFKLIKTAEVNAWIIYKQVKCKDIPQLEFIIDAAEELIYNGRQIAAVKRIKKMGRPSNRRRLSNMSNVGDHLPEKGPTRKRCRMCAIDHKEKRTYLTCTACKVPLCDSCFTPFHQ